MLWIKCALMASAFYDIKPEIVFNIIRVESRYCTMRQKVPNRNGSWDWGCMQINDISIRHYGFDKRLVRHDVCANIFYGTFMLSELKRRFKRNWVCRYHTGANLGAGRAKRCIKYRQKLKI